MEHFYNNLEGMFTFHELYRHVVQKFNGDNIKFVEVGAWKGKSVAFMAVEIINSGKKIEFHVVDPWLVEKSAAAAAGIDPSKTNYDEFLDPAIKKEYNVEGEDQLYRDYIRNIEPVKDVIKSHRMPSLDAVNLFEDESIDFIFLDGDHSYEYVKQELHAWYPKVKPGGVIAGHDYIELTCGVKQAVDEFFGVQRVKQAPDGSFYVDKIS